MILLAIAITILCIGSVSAVEETNTTLETVNEISQNENIVVNEMTDVTITNDDSKGESIVSDSNDKQNIENKEILKVSDGEDALSADVTGYIQIRETNSETTGTFESNVGEEIGIDVYWQSISGMQFQLLVNDNSVQSFYPSGYGYDWTDTVHYTPESAGTYTIMVICQGSSNRYISNTLTWEVSGSSTPKATQVDITVPSTGILDYSFNIPYMVTTTNGKAVNEGILTFYDQNGQIGSPITLTSSSGTFTHTYSTENTYNIYAKYTGNDNYEDSQSSTSSIIISSDDNSDESDITLNIVQSNSDYLYPFTGEQAWISVLNTQRQTDKQYKVKFDVKFKNNIKSSPKFEYSADGLNWNALSLFDETDLVIGFSTGYNRGWITDWNMIYGVSDKSSYFIRVSDNGKTSNTVTIKCLQGTSYISNFDYTPESGDEGTTIDFKFKPILDSGYTFTEGYVSFFSDESRDVSSLLGTLTASSSSEFSNQYLTGQITLPLVDATGEYTVYYAFVGKTSNGGYNDLDSFTLTINDVAAVNKDTTISLSPASYTITQGESQIITPSVIDSDSQSVDVGTITYYDNGNPITGYIEVPVDTPFATTNLAIGNHKITAKYNGGNGYEAGDSNSVNVTVKSAVGFTISVTSPTYPGTAVATVTGESGKTYTITVTNTDKSFTVTIPEGETQITQDLGELAAGNNYEAIVTYDGENNNTNFDISKGNPNLSITVNGNDTLIGEAKNIIVSALGNGKFTINDETAEHELTEIIDLTELEQSATYTIHYKETDNYTSADKTVTISVLSAYKTSIVIELNENTITKGQSITVTPTVTDEKGNTVTKGIITFHNSADEVIGTIDLEKNTTFTFNPTESDSVHAKYLDNESLKLTGNTSSAESFTVEKQKIQTIVTLELSTNELVTGSGQITVTPHVIGVNGEEVDAGSITIKDVSSLWDSSGQITRNINLGESTIIIAPYSGLDTSKNPYSLYVWYNGGEGSEYIFENSKSTNPTYYYHVYYNNAAELKINNSVEFTAYIGDKITFYANLTGGSAIKLFKDGVESEIVLTPNTEYTLTLTENGLGDFKYYVEYAAGSDNYRYASAVSNNATLHVKSKTTPEITLDVNTTKINQGEKVKFNVTVKYDGAKIEEGQVAFYYDGESEAIEIINLAEKDYIELDTSSLTKGNTYTVNAKYLGYGAYGNVTSTNKEFKVKSTLPITITVDGENEEDIEVSYSKSVTIAADCGDVTPELIILVDGVETSYKIREGYKTQSYTFYPSDKGQHNITVKFGGNDDYEESLSNNVTVNVYKLQTVRPTISFNVTDYTVEGQKVLITINTGDAPLNITLYRDSYANDEITHIGGETSTYEFTVDKTSGSEPNYNKYIYGSYDDTVKDYVIYYGDGSNYDFSGYFKVARENHMNITLNNENVTLTVTYGDTVTIKALLDYYRSISSGEWYAPTYSSNITIYMDDGQVIDVFAPVSATELNDYTLELNSEKYAGTHTIYAVYGGVKYTDSSYGTTTYYLPATSNTVTLNVNNKQTSISLNPDSLTIKNGDSEEITPTLSEDIVTGNITYYDGENPIEGYIEVPLTTVFNTADLAIGIHNITVKYNGAKGYDASEKSNTVKVTVKGDKTAKVEVTGADYPNNVTIKVTSEIPGEYTVDINNTPVAVTVAEGATYGEATFKFAAGLYYANITSSPVSELYDMQTQNTTFSVTKAVNNVIVTVEDVTLPGGRVTVNVVADVVGTYVVKLNDTENTEITVAVTQSGVSASNSTTKKILSGKYSANTTFDDDKNYTVKITNATFNVVKGEITVKVTPDKDEFTYGENIAGKVEISKDLPFTLKINNQTVTVDSEGRFNAGVLEVNTYFANVTFEGSDDYNANSNKTEFNVKKATNNIKVIVDDTVLPNQVTVKVTADVDDTYIVNINGTEVSVKVENKSGVNTTALKAGAYEANVNYTNSNYDTNITKALFSVLKAKAELTISSNASEITEGEAIKLSYELSQNATGEVKFYDNGELITDINNIVLTVGNHNITAKYGGDDNYNGASDEITVKVAEKINNINLNITSATYPENITVKLTADEDGTYIVKINDTEIPVTVVNGSGEASVNRPAGNYNAKLENQSVDFTVSARDKATPELKSVFDDNVLTVEVSGDAEGNVTVKVGDNTYTSEIRDGKAVFNLSDLTSGNYTAQITYSGDENYSNATDSVKITIPAGEETPEKTNAEMNATVPNTITVGDNGAIDIKLPDDATGNITVLLDGKQLVNTEIINGTVSIPVNTVNPGVYVVEIRYSGDDKYNETTQMAAMLVNDKNPVKKDTIITANATLTRAANEHYKTGENGTDYYVTLTDTDGNPLANKTVQMAINGVIYEILTDINGQAHQIINMESANVYTYAFSFQGDDEYNAAPLTSTRLTVTKKATTITVKAVSFKKSAKTKKLTVTLGTVKNADGKTYLAKGKKITLKVAGKTYTGKTNAKNQVTFNLKLTKKGKFTAKIRFAGSKIYAASSKSVKITIR